MLYLVQATMNRREYTHYTCRTESAADRLALLLTEKRQHLRPIRVVEWEPTAEELAEIDKFADDSEGPK